MFSISILYCIIWAHRFSSVVAVVCFKPQRAAHTFNKSLPHHGHRKHYRESYFNCGFRGLFPHVVMSLCVKAEPPGSLYSERRSLYHACSYFSVISFNCAPFIFGIHPFSVSSSPVSALHLSMPILCIHFISPSLRTCISLLSIKNQCF